MKKFIALLLLISPPLKADLTEHEKTQVNAFMSSVYETLQTHQIPNSKKALSVMGKQLLHAYLEIDHNALPGLVGQQEALDQILKDASELTFLTEVNLANLGLTSLPDEVGKWVNLKKIILSRNKLTNLPATVNSWLRIKDINLTGNNIKALTFFAAHPTITSIDLTDNPLQKYGQGGMGETMLEGYFGTALKKGDSGRERSRAMLIAAGLALGRFSDPDEDSSTLEEKRQKLFGFYSLLMTAEGKPVQKLNFERGDIVPLPVFKNIVNIMMNNLEV